MVIATLTSIQATYHHLNLISLDIPANINNSKTAAAQGCNISLSYNGVTYDDVQILLMYDKDRYDCNRESLQCTAKEVGITQFKVYTSTRSTLDTLFLNIGTLNDLQIPK